jgi:hypothetical protein
MEAGERSQRIARHVSIQYLSARPDGCFGARVRIRGIAAAQAFGTSTISLSRIIERSNTDVPRWEASNLSGVRRSHWPA